MGSDQSICVGVTRGPASGGTRTCLGIITVRQIRAFWSKMKAVNGCLEWQAHRDAIGYGKYKVGVERKNEKTSKNLLAHRVAWELVNGSIPAGLVVMHTCDNRACCNTDHMTLGTQAENIADAVAKGHYRRGSRLKAEAFDA